MTTCGMRQRFPVIVAMFGIVLIAVVLTYVQAEVRWQQALVIQDQLMQQHHQVTQTQQQLHAVERKVHGRTSTQERAKAGREDRERTRVP